MKNGRNAAPNGGRGSGQTVRHIENKLKSVASALAYQRTVGAYYRIEELEDL